MPNEADTLQFLGDLAAVDQAAGVPRAAQPYRAGEITRLNRDWVPAAIGADDAIGFNWDTLTARVRDLERNDPAIGALRQALIDHVVGLGLVTTANAMADGELLEDFNFESDELFDDWADGEADVSGRLSLGDLQRQVFGEALDTGDGLLLRCADKDPGRIAPLCYQALEAEQLDTSLDRPAGKDRNPIRRGIETDSRGRPVAYWLFDAHPADSYHWSPKSQRILADRVTHVYLPGRPGATRGRSMYARVTQSARDLDNYVGSELTSAVIGSLFTMIHKTEFPTGNGFGLYPSGDTSASGANTEDSPIAKLGKGIVCQVGKDDTVEQIEAKRPNREAKTFVNLMLMLLGMGGGVSRYRVTRDYTGTTYVAARAAHLDDQAAFAPMQGFLGRPLAKRIRRRWTAEAVAVGSITTVSATQLRAQPRRWSRTKLMPIPVAQLDPEKETDSDLAAIGGGLASPTRVCARRGYSYRREIMQTERDQEFARRHNVEISYSRPSTPPNRASAAAPEESNAEPN